MNLLASVPVLRSGDYATARSFWTLTMGFSLTEEAGSPPRFGIFKRGAAVVFVDAWHGPDPAQHAGWRAYFHCDDVDALASNLRGRGQPVDGPTETEYGMREVTLRDPDGNLLCFGQDLA